MTLSRMITLIIIRLCMMKMVGNEFMAVAFEKSNEGAMTSAKMTLSGMTLNETQQNDTKRNYT
jgi:hypothetical protein